MSQECSICDGSGILVGREMDDTSGFARVGPCACAATCGKCKGLGRLVRHPVTGEALAINDIRMLRYRERHFACDCRSAAERLSMFNRARIPLDHATCRGGNYESDGDPRLVAVMDQVTAWVDAFPNYEDRRGLILWGPFGTGKTHLLTAMVRQLTLVKGCESRFVEISRLCADLRAQMDLPSDERHDPMPDLIRAGVLAVDELAKGRERLTEYEATVLEKLISDRCGYSRPTIATTNYSPADLSKRVGGRLFSRMQEDFRFIEVRAEDYRALRAQRNEPRPIVPVFIPRVGYVQPGGGRASNGR